jgi:hypothetical protein
MSPIKLSRWKETLRKIFPTRMLRGYGIVKEGRTRE